MCIRTVSTRNIVRMLAANDMNANVLNILLKIFGVVTNGTFFLVNNTLIKQYMSKKMINISIGI